MCWLRLIVSRVLSPHENASGGASGLRVSCGGGDVVQSRLCTLHEQTRAEWPELQTERVVEWQDDNEVA